MMIKTNKISFLHHGVELTPNLSLFLFCVIHITFTVPHKAKGFSLDQPKVSNLICNKKSGNVLIPKKTYVSKGVILFPFWHLQ